MSRPHHVLALDQGTSSSRAIVFDDRAHPVASAQRELPSRYPLPGWVEQDADEVVQRLGWSAERAAQELVAFDAENEERRLEDAEPLPLGAGSA